MKNCYCLMIIILILQGCAKEGSSQSTTSVEAGNLTTKNIIVVDVDPVVKAMEFSPKGTSLAIGTSTGFMLVDTTSGSTVSSYSHSDQQNRNLLGQTLLDIEILHTDFSSDGRYILTIGNDNSYRIFDQQDKTYYTTGTGGYAIINTKKPYRIALLGQENISILDFDSLDLIARIPVNYNENNASSNSYIENFIISHDGSKIITRQNRFSSAYVWDSDTGEKISELKTGIEAFTIKFSPDDKYIVSTGSSTIKDVIVWNAHTYQQIWHLSLDHFVFTADFSGDGNRIAVGGRGNAWVFDSVTGNELFHISISDDSNFIDVDINENGQRLLTTGNQSVQIWNLDSGGMIFSYDTGQEIYGTTISLDFSLLAIARLHHVDIVSFKPSDNLDLILPTPLPTEIATATIATDTINETTPESEYVDRINSQYISLSDSVEMLDILLPMDPNEKVIEKAIRAVETIRRTVNRAKTMNVPDGFHVKHDEYIKKLDDLLIMIEPLDYFESLDTSTAMSIDSGTDRILINIQAIFPDEIKINK